MKPQRLEEERAQGSMEWLQSQMPAPTWDGLVQLQKAAAGDERYAILDLLEYFMNHVLVATYGHKGGVVDTVRSFFSSNRAELPSDPQFIIRADRVSAPGPDLRCSSRCSG